MSDNALPTYSENRLPPENVYGHTKKIQFIQRAIKRHQTKKNAEIRVLDFGCGSGAAVSQYLIGDGVHYYGVDFHGPSLDYAQTHFSGPNAHFSAEVPKDITFDVIVYSDVLEHLDHPRDMLALHAAQLSLDGIILGSIPNGYGGFENEKRIDRFFHLYDILRFVFRGIKRIFGLKQTPEPEIPFNLESGHVQFFTRRELNRVLDDCGFEIREFSHGSFMGADLSGVLFIKGPLIGLNVWLADKLPFWAVSTWHFEAVRNVPRDDEVRPVSGDSNR